MIRIPAATSITASAITTNLEGKQHARNRPIPNAATAKPFAAFERFISYHPYCEKTGVSYLTGNRLPTFSG